VRDRIGDEIERRDARDARHDAHFLDAQQQQARPEDIEELRGEDQRAERGGRGELLCAEGDSEMAQEDGVVSR
jgi:hypothetical protein